MEKGHYRYAIRDLNSRYWIGHGDAWVKGHEALLWTSYQEAVSALARLLANGRDGNIVMCFVIPPVDRYHGDLSKLRPDGPTSDPAEPAGTDSDH